jgi:putative transposase
MESDLIHVIRDVLNQELVLGRNDFKGKIEQMTKRQTRPGLSGRSRAEEVDAIYYVM